MFNTYDEADELRLACPLCGKHKLVITASYKPGYEHDVSYTLSRCDEIECEVHCQGHKHEIRLDDATDYADLANSMRYT